MRSEGRRPPVDRSADIDAEGQHDEAIHLSGIVLGWLVSIILWGVLAFLAFMAL